MFTSSFKIPEAPRTDLITARWHRSMIPTRVASSQKPFPREDIEDHSQDVEVGGADGDDNQGHHP